MNAATTRSLKPLEVLVLSIYQAEAKPLSLANVEKRMGPRGLRSPAAESHSFVLGQELLEPATDGRGNIIHKKFVLTEKGRKLLPHNIKAAMVQIDTAIADAKKRGMAEQEIERLEYIKSALPPIPKSLPHLGEDDADEIDRSDEEQDAEDAVDAPPPKRAQPKVRVPGRVTKGKSEVLSRPKTAKKAPPRKAAAVAA